VTKRNAYSSEINVADALKNLTAVSRKYFGTAILQIKEVGKLKQLTS